MASVFYRPSSSTVGTFWTSSAHNYIKEVTPSDVDYCTCAVDDDVYSYSGIIYLSGSAMPLSDIVSATVRFRLAALDGSDSLTSARSGQLAGILLGGSGNLNNTKTPTSSWTTHEITFTRSQMDTYLPDYDWNAPAIHINSSKQSSSVKSAISWLELEFQVAAPSGVPLYHLLNMM